MAAFVCPVAVNLFFTRRPVYLSNSLWSKIENVFTGNDRDRRTPNRKSISRFYDTEQIVTVRINSAELCLAITVGRTSVLNMALDGLHCASLKIAVLIRHRRRQTEAAGQGIALDRIDTRIGKDRFDIFIK